MEKDQFFFQPYEEVDEKHNRTRTWADYLCNCSRNVGQFKLISKNSSYFLLEVREFFSELTRMLAIAVFSIVALDMVNSSHATFVQSKNTRMLSTAVIYKDELINNKTAESERNLMKIEITIQSGRAEEGVIQHCVW